jgi:tetratricopeptide (TPR) repeat protein
MLVTHDPKAAFTYSNRGVLYMYKGDYDRAIREYDQAIQLDPKATIAYNNRGKAYVEKGDYDRAIQDYDQAIQLDPTAIGYYFDRGLAYISKGDYDRAIKDYDQAIQLDPKNAGMHFSSSRTYFYQGNFNAAAAAALRAEEIWDHAYFVIWRYLARERGGNDGAAELEAYAVRSGSKDWPYPVIELYLGKRSPTEVQATATKPGEVCEAQFYSGQWHLLRDNRPEAIIALQAAADTCPRDFVEREGALAELKRLTSGKSGP